MHTIHHPLETRDPPRVVSSPMSFPFFTHDCMILSPFTHPTHEKNMQMMQQQLLTRSHHLHRGMRWSILSSSGPEHLKDQGDDNSLWESRESREKVVERVFGVTLGEQLTWVSNTLSTWGDFFFPKGSRNWPGFPRNVCWREHSLQLLNCVVCQLYRCRARSRTGWWRLLNKLSRMLPVCCCYTHFLLAPTHLFIGWLWIA